MLSSHFYGFIYSIAEVSARGNALFATMSRANDMTDVGIAPPIKPCRDYAAYTMFSAQDISFVGKV
jgi:hypothetical protein